MRRKYSIAFLIFVIAVIFLLIFVYKVSYHKALAEYEAELLEKHTETEDCYYIMGTDGYVTVYFADRETIYEYTSIPVEELPEEVQKELKEGKKVNTIGQVYGFLENYSS